MCICWQFLVPTVCHLLSPTSPSKATLGYLGCDWQSALCVCVVAFSCLPQIIQTNKESILVFWCRCNKSAWTWWFETVQTYSLIGLEGRELTSVSLILGKSRCYKVDSFSRFQADLLASSSSSGCTSFACIMPITTVVTLHSPYKDSSDYVNPPM